MIYLFPMIPSILRFLYVEFEAILWKIDILSITAWVKFESRNPFAHTYMDTHNYDYLPQTTFRFYLIDFQVNTDFPFHFFLFFFFFFFIVKSLLKDWFLKKMLSKRPKIGRLLFLQNYRLNSFTLIENNYFRFYDSKFWIQGNREKIGTP